MNLIRLTLIAALLLGCANDESENPAKVIDTAREVETSSETSTAEKKVVEATIPGIDVSHFQHNVNWPAVKNAGIKFAFIKASGGVTWDDKNFTANWRGATSVGIKRGAYLFFYPDDPALAEVDNFISKVALEPGDLPPVIDIETKAKSAEDKADLALKLKRALTKLEQHYDLKPIIYSSHVFWNNNIAHNPSGISFGEYPLWIAEYGVDRPNMAIGWPRDGWTFWQHTANGKVDGIDGAVDLDLFNGSMDDLEKLCVQAPGK